MTEIRYQNIFITGGAGYVGSALVPELLKKGHHVTIYDLYLYGDTLEPHQNLTQIKGDIRDKEAIQKAAEGCDALIHLACISNDPSFDLDPELGKSINFDAFQNIIDTCIKNNVKRLIVASSTAQYGIKPIETSVTEDTIAEPITDYAKFKIECEKLLNKISVNFEYVFVRPATLCGYAPRLRLDLSVNILTINALVNKKIKIFGGNQMRPALNIKDMVRFYELMLEIDGSKIHQQAFNVATENITIQEIGYLVKNALGDDSITFEITSSDDNRSYHVNCDKMKTVLEFTCQYSLQDAVKSLQEAFQKGLIINGLENPYYYNVKRMKELGFR